MDTLLSDNNWGVQHYQLAYTVPLFSFDVLWVNVVSPVYIIIHLQKEVHKVVYKKVLRQAGVVHNIKLCPVEQLLYSYCAFLYVMVFKHSRDITILLLWFKYCVLLQLVSVFVLSIYYCPYSS